MAFPRSDSDGDKLASHVIPLAQRAEVYQFVWTASVFCVLVAIWTGLRVYSRTVRQMPLGLEDLLYHVSVASFYGFIVALFMATYLGGAGYHMSQLNEYHIARLTQSFLVIESLYGLSMCTVKWSILFMFKRIFAVRYFKIITWCIIGMQAAWLVMTVLIGFLICRPVEKNWDPTVEGTCGNRIAGYTAVSVVNVIVDCLMFVLPLPMVFNLQIKPGYKLGLFGIFGIGAISIIFSVIRLKSLNAIDFDDFAYTVVSVMTWTVAEAGVIIMVASSALLRPVFDKLFHRVLSLTGSRYALGPSNLYANSQSKMGSRLRKEFVNVGDGTGSDDFLELGQRGGPQTLVTVGTSRSHGRTATMDGIPVDEEAQAKGRMTIVVKSQVTQTYGNHDELPR